MPWLQSLKNWSLLETRGDSDCLQEALDEWGTPEVFNTDQGAQFTSKAFIGVLEAAGVAISMDGRGRALDNIFVECLWRTVKYEDVYLKGYATVAELTLGLSEYFPFYNGERSHQALDYRTPAEVYTPGCSPASHQWGSAAQLRVRRRMQLKFRQKLS